jgi:transcription elongation factor Elf1
MKIKARKLYFNCLLCGHHSSSVMYLRRGEEYFDVKVESDGRRAV